MLGPSGFQKTQINIQENKINELSTMKFNNKRDEELMEAAKQFEAVFINQLFKALDATIDREKMFSGGRGEEMFRSMFYDEIAKDIASSSETSFGLAKQIYEQMKDAI